MPNRLFVVWGLLAGVVACGDGSSGADATVDGITVVDSGPSSTSNARSATFAFHADGADHFECQLDAEAGVSCTSPYTITVADGSHTLTIKAYDGERGLLPAIVTWLVDTTPPDTMITVSPAAFDNSTTTQFAFIGIPSTDTTSFECSLDAAAFAACTSPTTITTVAGDHAFDVRATDALNNADPTPAHWAWTIDTTIIDTTITAGPAMSSSTQGSVAFAFTSTDQQATFECQIDTSPYAPCTSPASYVLSEGDHTFTVRARHGANVDPTPASRTWTVDTTAPTVTITGFPPDPTNNVTPSFAFSSSDVTATFECQVDGVVTYVACSSPWTSPTIADGTHTFRVRATDPAANSSVATYSWTQSTAAPIVNIDQMPADGATNPTATFAFSSPDNQVTFECEIDGVVAYATCTSPWSHTVPGGSQTFHVRGTNAANNQTVKAWTWTQVTAACAQPHHVCSGPWCQVAPVPTIGSFTTVYAVKGTNEAWAINPDYRRLYHFDSCNWSMVSSGIVTTGSPIAASDRNNVVFGAGLRWDGSQVTTAPAGSAVAAIDASNDWSGCNRWDGITWTNYGCTPTAIGAVSKNDVWLGGASGALWHWDGSTFTSHASPTGNTITTIAAFDASHVWIGTALDSYVWDGSTFTYSGAPGEPAAPSSVHDYWNGNEHWDGSAWTTFGLCPSSRALAVSYDSPTQGWCVGTDGFVSTWDGTVWTPYLGDDPGLQPSASFYPVSDTEQYAAGLLTHSGELLHNDGNTDGVWTSLGTIPYPSDGVSAPANTRTVFSAGGGEVWTLGQQGGSFETPISYYLLHYKAGNWTTVRQTVGGTDPLHDIKGSGPNDVWIGYGGELLHWDGTTTASVLSGTFRALWSPGANRIWALSSTLNVFDGTSWSTLPTPSGNGGANSLWGSSESDVWAVDNSTFSHWNGTMWTFPNHLGFPSAQVVWGSSSTDVFFVNKVSVSSTVGHFDGTAFTTEPAVPDAGNPPNPGDAMFINGDRAHRKLWFLQSVRTVLQLTAP